MKTTEEWNASRAVDEVVILMGRWESAGKLHDELSYWAGNSGKGACLLVDPPEPSMFGGDVDDKEKRTIRLEPTVIPLGRVVELLRDEATRIRQEALDMFKERWGKPLEKEEDE